MSKMLQVRNVPEKLHRRLKERAARRGMTLSAYVLEELESIADELPMDEWVESVRELPPVRLKSSVAELVRKDRDSH
ncbi:MAG: hypothetical protein K8T90_10045 [Planctomycetes bacterium]|nr:hypothetical protein [Planctomycetota bacterium]